MTTTKLVFSVQDGTGTIALEIVSEDGRDRARVVRTSGTSVEVAFTPQSDDLDMLLAALAPVLARLAARPRHPL